MKFRDGNADFGSRYRAALAAGDRAAAHRLAHDLRAIAGTLGATAIEQAARALEAAAADEHAAADAPLDAVLALLEPVREGLRRLG